MNKNSWYDSPEAKKAGFKIIRGDDAIPYQGEYRVNIGEYGPWEDCMGSCVEIIEFPGGRLYIRMQMGSFDYQPKFLLSKLEKLS